MKMSLTLIDKNVSTRRVFPVVIIMLLLICIYTNSNYTRIAEPRPVLVESIERADRSCSDMLQGGYLLQSPDVWQPYGCSLNNYTTLDFTQCLLYRAEKHQKITHIVFIGDSITRQYYNVLLNLVKDEVIEMRKFQHDEITDLPNIELRLEFRWATNSQTIIAFLDKWNSIYKDQQPDLLLANFCKHLQYPNLIDGNPTNEKYLSAYEDNLTIIRNKLLLHTNTTQSKFILTTPNYYDAPKLKKYWRTTKSLFDAKHKNDSKTMTDYYNDRVERVFRGSGVEPLGVFHTVVERLLNTTMLPDGLHVKGAGLIIISRIIVNYICNPYTPKVYRDTQFCCRKSLHNST